MMTRGSFGWHVTAVDLERWLIHEVVWVVAMKIIFVIYFWHQKWSNLCKLDIFRPLPIGNFRQINHTSWQTSRTVTNARMTSLSTLKPHPQLCMHSNDSEICSLLNQRWNPPRFCVYSGARLLGFVGISKYCLRSYKTIFQIPLSLFLLAFADKPEFLWSISYTTVKQKKWNTW